MNTSGSEPPPSNLGLWLKSQGQGKVRSLALGLIPHDMYVIGTQESSLYEKDWVNKIKVALQETLAQDMHVVNRYCTYLYSTFQVQLQKQCADLSHFQQLETVILS